MSITSQCHLSSHQCQLWNSPINGMLLRCFNALEIDRPHRGAPEDSKWKWVCRMLDAAKVLHWHPRKRDLRNCVPPKNFVVKKFEMIQIVCQKFVCSFDNILMKIWLHVWTLTQDHFHNLFVTSSCAVSQPLNRKITRNCHTCVWVYI